ncbi:hypothetical protein GEV33_005232 [Tenebrio molitor]|uniref:Uncharacterized protein n=1 Tax=Tenebrio molitor TaxID=7067 RepID=A0A8J6HMW3_TENMO|nr:hypothetical protein GEV33_005232 [Tenebrio molitor]
MGDFIPVEEDEPEDKGRLMREDDNDGSDDERIDMDVNLTLRDQERRREQFLAAQESDQEVDEWEHQQIRKGVTGASASLSSDLVYNEFQSETSQQQVTTIPAQAIDPGVPRTPQMIADKLREHYEGVCASREMNIKKLQQTQQDIEQITSELDELKTKAPKAAERFKFYQELRGYITDLVECLDEKVGIIANLEQRAMDQLAKRSEWLIERRRQDDQRMKKKLEELQSEKGEEREEEEQGRLEDNQSMLKACQVMMKYHSRTCSILIKNENKSNRKSKTSLKMSLKTILQWQIS